MRSKMAFAILACVLLLFSVACSPRPPQATITVTRADFDEQANINAAADTPLPAGKQFTVSLYANASDGFQWNDTVLITDGTVVKEAGHRLVSGQEIWTFNALTAGHATLTFTTLQDTGKQSHSFRIAINIQ